MFALAAWVTLAWAGDAGMTGDAGAGPDPRPATAVSGTSPPVAPPAEPAPSLAETPESSLSAAVRLYLDGDAAGAASALRTLLARGEELPRPLRLDALAYLGDIAYSLEGRPTARNIFSAILIEDPEYAMDPYEHPQDVCDYFETLRDEQRRATAPPPSPPRGYRGPFPYLVFVPGGVHYFANRAPAAGAAVAGVQVATLAANLALYFEFRALSPLEEGDTAGLRQYQDLQAATNLAGAAFVGSLVAPPAIAMIGWLSRPPAPPGSGAVAGRVSVVPLPGGLAARARF
jgi:hypothetical protein